MYTTRFFITTCILIGCSSQLAAQEVDSLRNFLQHYESRDSTRLDALLVLSDRLRKSDIKASEQHLTEAYWLADSLNHERVKAKASQYLGVILRRRNEYDSAFQLFSIAKHYYEQNDLKKDLGAVLISIGHLNKALNQPDSAFFYYKRASQTFGSIDLKNGQAIARKSMGDIQIQIGNYQNAMHHFQHSLKIFTAANKKQYASVVISSIGGLYYKLGKYDSSLLYSHKALRLKKKFNDKRGASYVYNNIASVFGKRSRLDSAIYYQKKVLEIQREFNNKEDIALALTNLTSYYSASRQFLRAEKASAESLNLIKEIGNLELLSKHYKYQYKLDSGRGDFSGALQNHKMYYSLRDSLWNRDKLNELQKLQTKYATELKEAEIIALTNENNLQNVELNLKNRTIIAVASILILIAITIFLYFRQRLIIRKKKQMSIEHRFLRSQLNPHFISNALVAIQTYIMKNEPVKATSYLSKFSRLMRQVLETSRSEFVTVDQEIELISDYLDIQKLRLNNAFEFAINIADDIDPELDRIPPMFIQPFIENAVEHGLENKASDGKIEVNLVKTKGFISVEILDNGCGISTSDQIKSSSLSTSIIKERMELFNSELREKIKLVLDNLENGGVGVKLLVPLG